MKPVPLCVDLDGTLIKTDVFYEGVLALARREVSQLARLPLWLKKGGVAGLKKQVAEKAGLGAEELPYRAEVVDYIKQAKAQGRPIILVTAASERMARAAVAQLRLFDEVMASSATVNLNSERKVEQLVKLFGRGGFDYLGDRLADVPVWAQARRAVVVSGNPWVTRAAKRSGAKEVEVLWVGRKIFLAWLAQLRVHQWIKNSLVFVPLLLAHRLGEVALWGPAALAFAALSLVASALYVVNDVLDIEADREHAVKRRRPLAAGDISLANAAGVVVVLLLLGFGLGLSLSGAFVAVLLTYALGSAAYSFWLKRLVIVDVLLLSGLYMLRLVAGAVATEVTISRWLLLLSILFFVSLALLKRYIELKSGETGKRRGYKLYQVDQIWWLGLGAGISSVGVLGLYILNSGQIPALYREPLWLWLVVVVSGAWVIRIWRLARRGEIDADPVVFALKDKLTWLAVGVVVALLYLAS
jgi:4-hydroxybenzoate polyprenyltransferase/phosphoserine phosphatase